MPTAPVPFVNQQSTGQDPLSGAPGVAINVMVDQAGTIRRRPGLAAAPGITSSVVDAAGLSGIYSTVAGKLYAVGSTPYFRQLYAVGPVFSTPLGTPLSDATLAGNSRPVFAETQLLLVIAGGDSMQKIVLSSDASSRLAGDPPRASHVSANSSRLLGNIAVTSSTVDYDKSVVRFSGISNGNTSYSEQEVWTEGVTVGGAGHFSAEANPDPVLAIYENTNEVFCFGTRSLQVFSPDGSISDTGIPAGWSPSVTRELGCSAPYSVIKSNQQFSWLDDLRRIALSDARSEAVISDPIKRELDNMVTVSDCFGYRVTTGALDAMVWTFPSDGRTFAFQKGSGWSQWAGWADGNWTPLTVTASTIAPVSHDVLVATSSGRIGRFSLDAQTDFGAPIVLRVDTGYINRGTDEHKHCKCVKMALRRGATASADSKVLLSWRDAPGAFCAPLEVSLGALGDTEIVVELRSLGTYRRRQWRFEFSGPEDLALVGMSEEFDVLEE
jgi:hypothetical protein